MLNRNSQLFILLFILMGLWSCATKPIHQSKLGINDYPYMVPFEKGQRFLISQAFHGKKTHKGRLNEYAVDIVMPIGTKVCAARMGFVIDSIDVNDDKDKVTKLKEYIPKSNYVKIQHNDGTVAVYAHLKKGSVIVSNQELIEKGRCFAKSGNSGASTGPHLHFSLLTVQDEQKQSIPFMFVSRRNGTILPKYLAWLYN